MVQPIGGLRIYLGDGHPGEYGVYARFDYLIRGDMVLTTEGAIGTGTDNTIYLSPEVMEKLVMWITGRTPQSWITPRREGNDGI